jgi:hypothetical protein
MERRKQTTFAEGGSAVGGLIIGVVLAVLIVANRDSGGAFDEATRDYAIAALACLPGTLCLLAGRSRPALYLAGGMIGGVIPMLLGILGIAFWIPAGLALVAYGRRAGSARGRLADPVVAFICFALAFAAFAAMFVHQDPASSVRLNSSEYTSDYVTPIEGLISLAITILTPVLGWVLSRPRSDARGSAVVPR